MPECAEARTVSDKLRIVLLGKIITKFSLGERAVTRGFANLKCPDTIIGVRSYGKKVLIDLSSEHIIIVSLGMTGRLQYYPGNHSHVQFDISEYEIKGPFKIQKPVCNLYFQDHRYMGGVDIIPNINIPIYFRDIGPCLLHHALTEYIPLTAWLTIYKQKKYQNWLIFDILLEQDLVAGIGVYCCVEILYYSGIHPQRVASTITDEEWDRIRISAHKVVALSYSYGGFTIEDFISPDGQRGMYPAAVYGRTYDPLGNAVIVIKRQHKRTMHVVPAIQK